MFLNDMRCIKSTFFLFTYLLTYTSSVGDVRDELRTKRHFYDYVFVTS